VLDTLNNRWNFENIHVKSKTEQQAMERGWAVMCNNAGITINFVDKYLTKETDHLKKDFFQRQ
jgi:hypothetical protein